jgi:hypothetical protein
MDKELEKIVREAHSMGATESDLNQIVDTYKKKSISLKGSQIGSKTLPFGSKPFQTQVDTSVPSVLTPKGATQYKEQVNIEAQKKKDLSKQLQSAKDIYYQAQGDASSFSLYDGLQSSLKRVDDEISKNYPDEATVSRTVPGQEDFEKYKAKRDQLVSDREKISQLSNEVLLRINPKIQSKIESDLKKNGLDKFTRSVYSGTKEFKVADELGIDNYAKQLAEESGISNDGTFKKLVYDKVKSTVSNEISSPGINKEFENLYVKETGLTPDQAVEKDQIKNFLEGKKIQLELSTSVDSLNKEIKEKIDNEVNTITQQYKPIIESINADYKTKIAEAEAGINQLNESYKAGVIPRPQYEAEFNNIKSQFNLLGEQYKQQSDDLSKVFLNNQNELFSKYNKRFNRQVYELQSMADQKLSAAIAKYGKEYKPSAELNSQFNSIYSKAAKNYFEKDESIKYQLDKSSLLNLVGGQTAKNLFIGFGGSLKNLSAMYDFDAGYVLGDYMENSFVSSSPEIKSAWDLLDFTKLQSSVGRMVGGMAPILGASALTASVTKSAPTALRLLTTGLSNYLIETAQIGGGIKNQVFQKTGNMADANKAAKKAMDANFFLLPLYALDGLPFLGNVTLGIKNTFARAGAKAGIEVLTETPQEYFQGIFEELAVADKPISDTFKNMTLERLEDTALNVIPTSVLLGGGGTTIKGVRESISKMQGRSLAAKVDLADLTETTKKQFIYDTVLRRGDVFSKAYVSSLFNSGNINEQEMESFSKMIDDSANIMAESKKIGLDKAQSKVYAALRFDYLQSKNEFDSEQDEVSKKLYKAKMDSAEKSLNTYLSGGKPDAVVLTLPNKEQYIYSFETLNSIINEGGEILNQIISGEVSIGLLSDKSNPKAKELSDKLTKLKQHAVQVETAGQVPVLTEATVGEEVEQGKPKSETEVAAEEGAKAEEVVKLRADEQAEYAAMVDPKDEVKRKEIYDKYDKLITPLLPEKVTPEKYIEDLQKTKQSDPEQYWSVDDVSIEDAKNGTVINEDGSYGLVSKSGDIKGVFKGLGSKAKNVADKILQKAVKAGGIKLDNFDTYLTKIYERNGFKVVSRIPFNEEYAPPGWNKEKHGTPDVVAMVYDPDNKLNIEEKTFDDYDEAIAYRDEYAKKAKLKDLPKSIDSKDLASKIRGLKINLGKGTAQSNIAGLPIALYNSTIEAVALFIEAGSTIAEAIDKAIKKYNLDKVNGFNKSELSKNIQLKNNPVGFDNIKKFASESSFNNKLEFKKAIQDMLIKNIGELKSIYGESFNPSKLDESTKKYLVDAITNESVDAISKHPESIGWYDEKTQLALKVMSTIHPEIETDSTARGAFILPLAIMSNGNKVDFNFDLAEKQYQYFKDNNRFDIEGGFGIQQAGIKKSLEMINSMLDAGLTMNDLNNFFTSKYRAGDLKVNIDGKVKNLASGELANESVYGAIILGPKIGNGFYMNLWGKFDQLTMDRWFMRTWGRLTGTLIDKNIEKVDKSKKTFLTALNSVKSDKNSLNLLKSIIGDIRGLSDIDIAKAIKKVSTDKDLRSSLADNVLTDAIRRASNNLITVLDGEKEAPSNGNERRFIRSVFDNVLEKLKSDYGIDVSMADLQAVLWYPEKILYESFKSGESFDSASEGYTIDSAPDYLNAAKKIVNKKGIDENTINKAIADRRRGSTAIFGETNEAIGTESGITSEGIAQKVKTAISGKEIGNTVRKLKINLGKGTAQSNIAGLPIALYNAVIETIALGLEAGDSLATAIKNAIEKYKLDNVKDFDKDLFISEIEKSLSGPITNLKQAKAKRISFEDINNLTELGVTYIEESVKDLKDITFEEFSTKIQDEYGQDIPENIIRNIFKKSAAAIKLGVRRTPERIGTGEAVSASLKEVANETAALYQKQDYKGIQNKLDSMSEAEKTSLVGTLASVTGQLNAEDNVGVLAAIDLINIYEANGDKAGAKRVFDTISKSATAFAQLLRQYGQLKSSTPQGYVSIIEKDMLDKYDVKLTDDQKQAIEKLYNDSKKAIDIEADALNNLVDDLTDVNYKLWGQTTVLLEDANRKLADYIESLKPATAQSLFQKLTSIVQGDLLTLKSLLVNPVSNAAQAGTKLSGNEVANLFDFIINTTLKTGRTKISGFDPLAIRLGGKAFIRGLSKANRMLIKGATTTDLAKIDVAGRLKPVEAWKSLYKTLRGKQAFEFVKTIENLAEGTIGVPANLLLRLLPYGDLPRNEQVKIAKLIEIGRNKFGLKGNQLEAFTLKPDPESLAEAEIEGDKSTLQESNKVYRTINDFINSIDSKGDDKFVRGLLSGIKFIVRATQAPFLKTPINYAFKTIRFTNPIIPYSQAVYHMVKAIKAAKDIKNPLLRESAIRKHQSKLTEYLGEAVIAQSIMSAALILIGNGLVTGSAPEEDKYSRERNLMFQSVGPNMINISGLKRLLTGGDPTYKPEDTAIAYNALGILGAQLGISSNTLTKKEKENIREKKFITTEGKPFYEEDKGFYLTSIVDMLANLPASLNYTLNQGFAQGTGTLLASISDNEYSKWSDQMVKTLVTGLAVPNTVYQSFKAGNDYYRDVYTKDQVEEWANIVQERYGNLEGLPIKYDMFGKPIKLTPEGSNPYVYNVLDIFRTQKILQNKNIYYVFDLYKKTGDMSVIPNSVKDIIDEEGGLYTKLTPDQKSELQRIVGEERAKYLNGDRGGSLSLKNYDPTNDSEVYWEKQVKKLKSANKLGLKSGKRRFEKEILSKTKK